MVLAFNADDSAEWLEELIEYNRKAGSMFRWDVYYIYIYILTQYDHLDYMNPLKSNDASPMEHFHGKYFQA